MKRSNLRTINDQIGLYDSVSVDVNLDKSVAITRYKVYGTDTQFNMIIISEAEARELLRVLQEELGDDIRTR